VLLKPEASGSRAIATISAGSARHRTRRRGAAGEVNSVKRLTEWIIVSQNRPEGRRPWTSLQFAYLALVLNGLGVTILFVNLFTGGGGGSVVLPIAIVLLVLGLLTGIQTRRVRMREANKKSLWDR